MMELLTGLGLAMWWGILTAISPCPLATNIAAISFIGRRVSSPAKVVLTGVLYAAGRVFTYIILGGLLTASLLSAPALSQFLQKYMNKLLGPMLILMGMVLVELIQFKSMGGGVSEKMQKRVEAMGMWGALVMGAVFALTFCPISAAWFFGSLLATSVKLKSFILVPAVFGIGTALPVLVFAVLIAVSAKSLGAAYNRLTAFEKWARWITGGLFILIGIYMCLRYIFGLFA